MRHPHGLRAVAGASGGVSSQLVFVGGGAGAQAISSQIASYPLTSLTGGIASAPSAGDIVVAGIYIESGADRNLQCTTTGYTELADLYADGGSQGESQLGVYYKVLSSAETSIAFDLGVSELSLGCVHVWRQINSTPLDATTVTATSPTVGQPNPPAITTVTNNAVVIAVAGASSSIDLVTPTAPSGMTNMFSIIRSPANKEAIMIASIERPTAGAYDPPSFGGLQASGAHCVATLALRPA